MHSSMIIHRGNPIMQRYLLTRSATRFGRLACGALLTIGIADCSKDTLLAVKTPDQITPAAVASAAGAQAQRVAGIGLFTRFFAADAGGGGVSINVTTAILGDEAFTARSGTESLDSRAQDPNSFPANAPSGAYGNAYHGIVRDIRAVNAFPPTVAATKATQIGQLYLLDGYIFTLMAEAYCNGIPVSNVTDDAPATTTFLTVDLYNKALVLFDSALNTLSTSVGDQVFRNAARVGKARVNVDLGNYATAATLLGVGGDGAGSVAVPTAYAYNVELSTSTALSVNAAYDWMLATKNFGASDKEGTNGLDYVSSKDPRITVDV